MRETITYEAVKKVPLSEFTPELEFEFTDAPAGLLESYILRAVDRFCEKTNCLRRHAIIRTQATVSNYLLEPPDCMQLVSVLDICDKHGCHGRFLRTFSEPCDCECRFTHYCIFLKDNELVFAPAACGEFQIEFSVKPPFNACKLDAVLRDKFYDAIVIGARSYLYGLSGFKWSSAQHALLLEQQFNKACVNAAVDTLTHGQRGGIIPRRAKAW